MSGKARANHRNDVSRVAEPATSDVFVPQTLSRLKKAIIRALPIAKEVDVPTYEKDRVSDIKRWDERDILFARKDFFRYFDTDSPEYKAYYEAHPEYLEYDTKVGNMAGLGKTGGIDVPMFVAQFEAIAKIGTESFVDGEPASEKTEIPAERAAKKVKAFARILGADLVKIGPLRQEWIYTHAGRSAGNSPGYQRWGTPIDLQHPNAVAMGFQMDYDLSRTGPDFPTLLATAKGYAIGAWVSIQLAAYIRMLGYSARAHHLDNYQVIAVPVAIDCGLGELSRAGYLITKELGLGLRLAIVTTDMPLAHDKPVDIGVQSFCEVCKICAKECPIGAIPMGDKVEFNGIKKWRLDEGKCYRYWHAVGTDCSLCVVSCPWTKPKNWFHKTMSVLATVKGPHQSLMTLAEKLFYGKYKSAPRPDFIDPYER
jgi:ferredoxin